MIMIDEVNLGNHFNVSIQIIVYQKWNIQISQSQRVSINWVISQLKFISKQILYMRIKDRVSSFQQKKTITKANYENENKIINKKRKSSPIVLRYAIVQKLDNNEQHHTLSYESRQMRVRVNIYFSQEYKLSMILSGGLKIQALQQLVGCYVKLHLKHRPSQQHVYGGLQGGKNILLNKMIVNKGQISIKQEQQNQDQDCQFRQINKDRVKQSIIHQQIIGLIMMDQILLLQNPLYNKESINYTINTGTLRQMLYCHRYIRGLKNRQKLQLDQQQSPLHQPQQDNNHINNIDELCFRVRYNRINKVDTININSNNNDSHLQLITLNPTTNNNKQDDQQILISSTPKQSLSYIKNNKNINKINDYDRLIKWFTQTQLIDWLICYYTVVNNNNNHKDIDYVKMYPVRLLKHSYHHNNNNRQQFYSKQQQSYVLVTINWSKQQQQQQQLINNKLNLITKYFINKSHLLLTHIIEEMYCFSNKNKQCENIQFNSNNVGNEQCENIQFNSNNVGRDSVKYNNDRCEQHCLIVLRLQHIKTINLKAYLIQIIKQLIKEKQTNTKRQIQTERQIQREQHIVNTLNSICGQLNKLLRQLNDMSNILSNRQCIIQLFQIKLTSSSLINKHYNQLLIVNSLKLIETICCNDNYKKINYSQGSRNNNNHQRVYLTKKNTTTTTTINKQTIHQRVYKQIITIINTLTHLQSTRYQISLIFSNYLNNNNKSVSLQLYTSINYHHKHSKQQHQTNQNQHNNNTFINYLYQQTNNHNTLYTIKKIQQSKLQQLQIFKHYLIQNKHYIHFNHTYQKPYIFHLHPNQPINIYEKQTTLKKRKYTHTNHNNNSPNQNNDFILLSQEQKIIRKNQNQIIHLKRKSNNKQNINKNINKNNNKQNINKNKNKKSTKKPTQTRSKNTSIHHNSLIKQNINKDKNTKSTLRK